MPATKKEQTAGRIRETALVLFSREGYYHASIRQIASEAGIALGLLYSYYPGKEALLKNLFQFGISRIKEDFLKEGPGKSLSEQTQLVYDLLMRYQSYWRLFHSVRMQKSLADYLGAEIEDISHFFLEHFRHALKKQKAKNPRSEALILWSSLDGLFARQQTMPDLSVEKPLRILAERFAS